VCCSVLQCVAVCCRVDDVVSSAVLGAGSPGGMQCAVVCCSVLQCAVVCCSVLQGVVVCCSVLQGVAVCYREDDVASCAVLRDGSPRSKQCVAVCCDTLSCVAVCCSVLQYVSVCCSVFQCDAVCVAMRVAVCFGASAVLHARSSRGVHCVTVCYSVLQCVAVCCSVLQCAVVCCSVLQRVLNCAAVCTHARAHTHTHTRTHTWAHTRLVTQMVRLSFDEFHEYMCFFSQRERDLFHKKSGSFDRTWSSIDGM